MKIGKLPNDLLNKLILEPVKGQNPPIDEILAGPSIGEDCALLDFDSDNILVSSDPITATEENIGRLLVTVCVNDIAASGGKPVGIMVTALLPPSVTERDIKAVMNDLLDEAKKQNIAVLGGHTEITDAVNRIVLSGTAIGRVLKNAHLKTSSACLGDKIVITKSAGLEGTSILACERQSALAERFGHELVEKAKSFSENTSVIKEAEIARKFGASSMHDITEGGLLGACAEASWACGHGFKIDLRKVPVTDETKKICRYFGISPYELVSSGALLITVKDADGLIAELNKNGCEGTVIGGVTEGKSVVIGLDGEEKPLEAPVADAVYAALSGANKTVIFVCTGNTCRSPMAQGFAIFAAGREEYRFISRGLNVCECSVSENSFAVMKEKGIDISDITPTGLTLNDVEKAYAVITMTKSHKRFILERYKNVADIEKKVFTLFEYAAGSDKDISDPYGLGPDEYRQCAVQIEECVSKAVCRLFDNNL